MYSGGDMQINIHLIIDTLCHILRTFTLHLSSPLLLHFRDMANAVVAVGSSMPGYQDLE